MDRNISDEPLELEEFDVVEDAELEPVTEPDISTLDLPCIQYYQRNFLLSSFPSAILDTSLQIIWKNIFFNELFSGTEQEGASLLSFFSLTVDESTRSDIHQCIKKESKGYSWQGRIEIGGKTARRLQINLLIIPIFDPSGENETASPICYHAVLDDVTDETRSLVRSTFTSLLEASILKDNDTGQHIVRVNEYCRKLSQQLLENDTDGIDGEFIDAIGYLASMHDVGKIGTPDDILNKEGPLEDWQWDIMKEHTINGAYILSTYPSPLAKEIALFHHEKWSGKGYPYALSEDMIPLAARIVSIADVYDALRMKRSYKTAFTHSQACEEISAGKESHFDPVLADVFLSLHQEMENIYTSLAD